MASELEEGDVLRTQDGKTETVASVEMEALDEPVKVYNLEIEDSHTYYVSVDGVLVHNACGDEIKNKYATHHIVASSSPNAQEARDILDLVGIGYNDSKNGVFLPMGDFGTGANHNRLHTKKIL